MRLRWIVGLAVFALAAGCTSPNHSSSHETPSTTRQGSGTSAGPDVVAPLAVQSTLNCADAALVVRRAAPLRVVLGVVALPVSPGYPALQTWRTEASPRLFAKTGLFVRPGARLTVSVPSNQAQRPYIGWGNPAKSLSREVVVPACPGPAHQWLAWPGGYWIEHPACVSVVVHTDSRQRTVRIGLGTPCPGQRPPQPPTER